MKYIEFGITGKKLSIVGFGGARFNINNSSNEECASLMHYARGMGINYFDTAPGYCQNRSQEIFGLAFRDMKKPFYVSTKGMPDWLDTIEKTGTYIKKTLDILNVDKIDFFFVWSLRSMDQYENAVKKNGLYEGLLKAKEEGLIDHIFVSSHQPGDEIKHVIEDSRSKFEGLLIGANVINFPYRWDGVEAAYANRIGVIIMNPLAGGLIPQYEERFNFLSFKGYSPTENALRFLLGATEISIVLIGFSCREHIDMACRLVDINGLIMTQEEIKKIKSNLGVELDNICTGCGYCNPCCPNDINIAAHMQVCNEKYLFGKNDDEMSTLVRNEYKWGRLVNRESEYSTCISCRKCEQACTQLLPIVDRLKYFDIWHPESERITIRI